MKDMHRRITGLFFMLAILGMITGCQESPLVKKEPVRMVCRLMGEGKTANAAENIWEGDLGVMFTHGERVYLLAGDTMGPGIFAPNAIAYTTDRFPEDCLDFQWRTDSAGNPQAFFPRIDPDSTVPAGAISIDNIMYIFMMDVTQWGVSGSPETHARPLLIKSTDSGTTFSSVWTGKVDEKCVNIAPAISSHPHDQSRTVVYLLTSGTYRKSPIYLAMTDPDAIEDRESYRYFAGYDDGTPVWTADQEAAVPVVDGVRVGELSVAWNAYLDQWLLSYFNYTPMGKGTLHFRKAPTLWGPWSEPVEVFSGTAQYGWYKKENAKKGAVSWGGPYGGYILEELTKNNGKIVYFTLSLWTPYTIFLMEADLEEIFE
jgi:hypothetical protein